MKEVALRLNPKLDPAHFAEIFRREGVVQISHLFETDVAQAISAILERDTPWRLVYSNAAGRQDSIDQASIESLGDRAIENVITPVLQRASSGFAYLYLGYDMLDAYLQQRDPQHPIHMITEFLNTEHFRGFTQAVIGGPMPTKTEAYASLYRPGDFLNLHDDSYRQQRLAAYTIGFTRSWRPDWGGQLLFHGDDGNITKGLQPGFNVLTLFRTPQNHSVAQVASYARSPRVSLIGWLRGDPPGSH